MHRNIMEILSARDGHHCFSVSGDSSVADAVRIMNEEHIGSVLVREGPRMVGIFTERDVLRRVVQDHRDPETTAVSEVMTRDPATIGPEANTRDAMQVMTRARVRHLPIVDGDELLGLISIGDLVAAVSFDLTHEVEALHSYIHGPAARTSVRR